MSIKIKLFINQIFQHLTPEEHIIFWASAKSSPGFPISSDKFFTKVLRENTQKACYFSTSTVTEDDNGKLYNRQKLFSRMFCIILDDIGNGSGSKCKINDLPEMLRSEYSWRIETSPGNFQYGFLLDEPIDNLNAAKEFVKIIYGAGPWDTGGAMPNKLVRLPCGVNLKKKYTTHDELWMLSRDETPDSHNTFNVFSPDELLSAVNAGVTWADILAGIASKIDPRRTRGTTAWREGVYRTNLHGIVDDVLEWLNEEELIINENNEWIDIKCPWADEHTDGANTAGYKPLGHGDMPDRRLFHCFHSHCNSNRTSEFLAWVKQKDGPIVPMVDPIPALVSQWAFDASSNSFIDISTEFPLRLKDAGFKTGHQQDVFWIGLDGKPKKATQYGLIVKSPGLLRLYGSKYTPGGSYIIEQGGKKFLNSWHIPNWEIRKTNDSNKDWHIFTKFIHYLMPENNDADWFLDHLASKVQNPVYRGPGVLLTTPVYGSGRGTLSDMIRNLWGSHNLATVTLKNFIGGVGGDGFTDWLQSLWIIISESKESTLSRAQECRAYEALKTGVDPRPTSHLIKHKWGGQSIDNVYSSFIACSNHRGQLNIPMNDRRFKSINCTIKVAPPAYFTTLNKWLDGHWEANVWHELLIRDISGYDGFAPQNTRLTNDEEADHLANILAGQSCIDRLVTVAIKFADTHCEGVMHTGTLCDWIAQHQVQLDVSNIQGWESIFKRQIQNATAELKYQGKRRPFRIDGIKAFARHTLTDNGYLMKTHTDKTDNFEKIKDLIIKYNAEFFRDFVLSIFNEAGL